MQIPIQFRNEDSEFSKKSLTEALKDYQPHKFAYGVYTGEMKVVKD